MLDLPHVVDAERVGELDLVERVLDQLVLGVVAPRPRQLVLVEDAELHRAASEPGSEPRATKPSRMSFATRMRRERVLDLAALTAGAYRSSSRSTPRRLLRSGVLPAAFRSRPRRQSAEPDSPTKVRSRVSVSASARSTSNVRGSSSARMYRTRSAARPSPRRRARSSQRAPLRPPARSVWNAETSIERQDRPSRRSIISSERSADRESARNAAVPAAQQPPSRRSAACRPPRRCPCAASIVWVIVLGHGMLERDVVLRPANPHILLVTTPSSPRPRLVRGGAPGRGPAADPRDQQPRRMLSRRSALVIFSTLTSAAESSSRELFHRPEYPRSTRADLSGPACRSPRKPMPRLGQRSGRPRATARAARRECRRRTASRCELLPRPRRRGTRYFDPRRYVTAVVRRRPTVTANAARDERLRHVVVRERLGLGPRRVRGCSPARVNARVTPWQGN